MFNNGAKNIVAQPNWFVICILWWWWCWWWWWWWCWWLTFLLVGQLPKRFVVLLRPLCPSPIQGTCSFPSLSQGFLWNVQFAFCFHLVSRHMEPAVFLYLHNLIWFCAYKNCVWYLVTGFLMLVWITWIWCLPLKLQYLMSVFLWLISGMQTSGLAGSLYP